MRERMLLILNPIQPRTQAKFFPYLRSMYRSIDKILKLGMLVFLWEKKKNGIFVANPITRVIVDESSKKYSSKTFYKWKSEKVIGIDPRTHSGIGFSNNASRERESL